MTEDLKKLQRIIDDSKHIVIIQADNPDADSLASSLALEAILEDIGKTVSLYCGVDLPSYLHYLQGWSRVSKDLPKKFDAAIVVDTASLHLLEQLDKTGSRGWLASRPVIVIDHHASEATIDFAAVMYTPAAAATGEIIYELAKKFNWPISSDASNLIAIAILSDSLGLMSASTTARTIHIIGELVEKGVNLPELESARRETLRREPELIGYKGQLLQRVEFHDNGRIATVDIPWQEIEKYSPLYNPSMLVIDDMRLAKNTEMAIAFKIYRDGKVTAKIRCNYGFPVADKLAEYFGGGGHPQASGFKVTNKKDFTELKNETITKAAELLDTTERRLAE